MWHVDNTQECQSCFTTNPYFEIVQYGDTVCFVSLTQTLVLLLCVWLHVGVGK